MAYEEVLWELGFPAVETATDFEDLRSESVTAVARIGAEMSSLQQQLGDVIGPRKRAAHDQLKAASDELKRVERIGTTVPPDEDRMRGELAAAIGVTAKQLPYVCELMDLRPEHTRWRKAVEKVLRSTGLVLLVPDRYHHNALRYAHEHHMRGLLRIEHVAAGGPNNEPQPGTLAECLQVTDWQHECARAARNRIAASGDYVRVEHPDDFARHRRAVTDEGLRKESERRAVKDDRRDLRASQYIYQGNIEDKIVALREELYEAQDAAEAADQAMDEVLTKHSALGLEKERWSKLHSQFEQFSQIDATAAEAAVQRLRDQLDALLEANPDLTELKKQAEQYLEDITALSERQWCPQRARERL